MKEQEARGQLGQSIVIVAVAMVALVLFVSIAVDISNAYVRRRMAQNAADAAALAGGRQLAHQIEKHQDKYKKYSAKLIKEDMNAFAESNGIQDSDLVSGNGVNDNVVGYYLDEDGNRISESPIDPKKDVPNGTLGVEAITKITAQTFFGGIFGLDGLPLEATASVVLQGTCTEGCLVPISVYDLSDPASPITQVTDFDPDSCYNIWNGDGPGNFGWLNWSIQKHICGQKDDRCNATCLADNLDPNNCNSGLVEVGDDVAGTTGVVNASFVGDQLKKYIDGPISFVVPVWRVHNNAQGCGNEDNGLWYEVAGFARMQLLGYQLSQGGGTAYGWDGSLEDGTNVCITLGEPPNNGNRLTAKFVAWVSGQSGNCGAGGTLLAPRLIK